MKKVLVLNRDYQPLQIITWRKAFVKMFSEANPVSVVDYYDDFVVRSMDKVHRVPSVLVIRNKYVRYKREVSDLANYRKYIYVRDSYNCQYCDKSFKDIELTVDHVVPKSKGGPNTWTNLVTCCKPCNSKKGDKSTHEAKMFPTNVPRGIRNIDLQRWYFMSHKLEDDWEPYLRHIL